VHTLSVYSECQNVHKGIEHAPHYHARPDAERTGNPSDDNHRIDQINQATTNHTTTPAAHNSAHLQQGVLSGIRVLDFTWKTVGPWAPRLLTHYGAEVIHDERAGGWDDHRFAAHRSITTDAPEPNHVQGEKQL